MNEGKDEVGCRQTETKIVHGLVRPALTLVLSFAFS